MSTKELYAGQIGEGTAEGLDQHEVDAEFLAIVDGIQTTPESEAASREFSGKTNGRNDPGRAFTQR